MWDFHVKHLRIVSYYNITVKENVHFRARAEKGMLHDTCIGGSSVVWTLIDNGKLGNQIARLSAIVVKNDFYHDGPIGIR